MSRPASRLFDFKKYASELCLVATDRLEACGVCFETRFYQSGPEVDVVIWSDKEFGVMKFQVSIFGEVVEWSRELGFRSGIQVEIDGQMQLLFDETLDLRALRQTQTLLSHLNWPTRVLMS